MRTGKFSLSGISEMLSRDEMKKIKAGCSCPYQGRLCEEDNYGECPSQWCVCSCYDNGTGNPCSEMPRYCGNYPT